MQLAPIISDETIKNENECCYTFDFPTVSDKKQKDMIFFYAKEEKAYKTCYKGVKNAYPNANYGIVSGYGHLTYSVKEKEKYIEKLKELLS